MSSVVMYIYTYERLPEGTSRRLRDSMIGKSPSRVDVIENGGSFHSYVRLPEGICCFISYLYLCICVFHSFPIIPIHNLPYFPLPFTSSNDSVWEQDAFKIDGSSSCITRRIKLQTSDFMFSHCVYSDDSYLACEKFISFPSFFPGPASSVHGRFTNMCPCNHSNGYGSKLGYQITHTNDHCQRETIHLWGSIILSHSQMQVNMPYMEQMGYMKLSLCTAATPCPDAPTKMG